MKRLIELLGIRDEESIITYINSRPEVLTEQDKSGASGFMQVLYHRLPAAVEAITALMTSYTFDEAIATGRIEEVMSAVEANEELVVGFLSDGFTPIGLATFFSQAEVAQYLFDQGADPSVCANNSMKVNAMHAAAATGNHDLMEVYLTNGYDANIPQMNNITPVQSASYRGDLDMVKLLVRHGADHKIASVDGIDAIGYAAEGGHEAIVFYLQSIKADNSNS